MGSGCCDWARLALPQLSVTGGCAGQMGGWSVGGLETHGDKEQDLQKSLCKRGRHRRFGQEVAGGGEAGGLLQENHPAGPRAFLWGAVHSLCCHNLWSLCPTQGFDLNICAGMSWCSTLSGSRPVVRVNQPASPNEERAREAPRRIFFCAKCQEDKHCV